MCSQIQLILSYENAKTVENTKTGLIISSIYSNDSGN